MISLLPAAVVVVINPWCIDSRLRKTSHGAAFCGLLLKALGCIDGCIWLFIREQLTGVGDCIGVNS